MGWDTQIIIIAENIDSIEESKIIGKQIFDKDSKRYGKESFYIIEENTNYSIFYTYERRKYAPYWSIEEISMTYPKAKFTILGSMLDFLCGPGGLFKIIDGKILDSYGIWGEDSKRHRIICNPKEYKYLIYDWFNSSGRENEHRIKTVQTFPLGACNDNLVDKIIPIDESEVSSIIDKKESVRNRKNWVAQKLFEPIISHYEYKELRSKSKNTIINEESFIAFVAYSDEVSRIESKVLGILNGEQFHVSPFNLYDRTFGPRAPNLTLLQSEFNYLDDLENRMASSHEDIVKWAIRNLENKEQIRLTKGCSITWMINVINEEKRAGS